MSFLGKWLGGQNTKYVFLFFVEYVKIYAFLDQMDQMDQMDPKSAIGGPKLISRAGEKHIQTNRKALPTLAANNAFSHNNFSCVQMGARDQKINMLARGVGVRISQMENDDALGKRRKELQLRNKQNSSRRWLPRTVEATSESCSNLTAHQAEHDNVLDTVPKIAIMLLLVFIWQYWHFDLRLKDWKQVRGQRVLGNKDQPKSFGKIFTSTNVALSPLESLESFVFRANCSVCVQTLPNPPLGIITPIWQASFDKEAPQTAIALIKARCQFSLFTHAATWLGGIR